MSHGPDFTLNKLGKSERKTDKIELTLMNTIYLLASTYMKTVAVLAATLIITCLTLSPSTEKTPRLSQRQTNKKKNSSSNRILKDALIRQIHYLPRLVYFAQKEPCSYTPCFVSPHIFICNDGTTDIPSIYATLAAIGLTSRTS